MLKTSRSVLVFTHIRHILKVFFPRKKHTKYANTNLITINVVNVYILILFVLMKYFYVCYTDGEV